MSDFKRWMVLGASPCAAECHCIPEVDAVAAAGASILIHRPDFYFIYENDALWKHMDELAEARQLGTKVILGWNLWDTLKHSTPPIYDYPCDDYLPLKKCINSKEPEKAWKPGVYVPICGGGLALQWAVNHGASEIHLVGMEGYRGRERHSR